MRLFLSCLVLSTLGSCAQLTGDQWRWMDEPAQQQWVEFTYEGWGREIRFAVPNRLKGSTNRVRSRPHINKGVKSITLSAPPGSLYSNHLLGSFHWDYWWGGVFKSKGTDFVMSVSVTYSEESPDFLDMDAWRWADWRSNYWRELYSDSNNGNNSGLVEKFFSDYLIEPYESKNSLIWVYEKYPTDAGNIFEFHLPVSDDHVLSFWFRISGVRNGINPDPAWSQRRLELAYKIMDRVKVAPLP